MGRASLIVLAAGLWTAAASAADAERGRRLYFGEVPMVGRVAGHSVELPPDAVRCINCHAAGSAAPASSGAAATASFAPPTC
jgi:hypothetical protein